MKLEWSILTWNKTTFLLCLQIHWVASTFCHIATAFFMQRKKRKKGANIEILFAHLNKYYNKPNSWSLTCQLLMTIHVICLWIESTPVILKSQGAERPPPHNQLNLWDWVAKSFYFHLKSFVWDLISQQKQTFYMKWDQEKQQIWWKSETVMWETIFKLKQTGETYCQNNRG